MSSFLFLTFCVYVFCCLGLHFSAVPLSNPFFRWLFTAAVQTSTGVSHGFNRAGLWLRWCRSPTCPPKSHAGSQRAEFWFSLQNELTPPPKGGGAGLFSNSGCLGLLDFSTAGSHRFNGAGNSFRWCRSPTWPAKLHTGSHRAKFGFCSLAGTSQRECQAPFQNSHVRIQAEEKTPLPCF